jgi:cell division protein FtsN
VAQNRPKKQSISTVVIAFALVIIAAYALGVATGWLFFRLAPQPVAVAKPANVQLPAAGTTPPTPPAATAPAAPLTFYETLPKGEKAVMGSGLNPPAPKPTQGTSPTPHPEGAQPAAGSAQTAPAAGTPKVLSPADKSKSPSPPTAKPDPVPSAAPPSAAKVKPVVPAPPATKDPGAAASTTQPSGKVKPAQFAVQIASTTQKSDAEAIRLRHAAKGLAAYVVVSDLKEKGIWYRVRVGHKLTEKDARQLAGKIAATAVVVPD